MTVFVIEPAVDWTFAVELLMHTAIVLELDPGLCGVIERAQVEIVDAVEHLEQSSFNGSEKRFLLAVLMGRVRQCRRVQDAEP
jgi:hypothetical protein